MIIMDELEERIAGEITLSDAPGTTMKKWRELFGISQIDLAKYLGISPSTISDYESNRRNSPGVGVIKRFVKALIDIDNANGGHVAASLKRLSNKEDQGDVYLIHDFSAPIDGNDFVRMIEAKIVASPNAIDKIKVFGYTLLDSIRVITEISPSEYPKLFGSTTERAFIFDKVTTGRSPMVVIRVAPIKPKVVVIPGLESVDRLAIKISQIEQIPLLTTKLNIEEIRVRLDRL